MPAEIAAQVRHQGGHHVLAVPFDVAQGEGNQPAPHAAVVALVDDLVLSHAKGVPGARVGDAESSVDTNNHGRVETRRASAIDDVRWLGADLRRLCRLRVGHGAENFSRLRRIALNKPKRPEPRRPSGTVMKVGLRTKQRACGWSRKVSLDALLA